METEAAGGGAPSLDLEAGTCSGFGRKGDGSALDPPPEGRRLYRWTVWNRMESTGTYLKP